MKKYSLLITLPLVLLLIATCSKSQNIQLTPIQVKRVVKTCQLWGHIKYFHPYLKDKTMDWESAFTNNIENVIQSKGKEEFAKAIQLMLNELNDPSTKVLVEKKSENNKDTTKYPTIKFLKDSVLLVSVRNHAGLEDFYYSSAQFATLKEKIPLSKGVIFDLRSKIDSDDLRGWLAYYFVGINQYLIGKSMLLPGLKARMHDGFAPETGGTSGGYYSGTYVKNEKTITPTSSAFDKKLVFVVNGESEIPIIALSLQHAGQAKILSTSLLTDASIVESSVFELEEGVKVNIRLNQLSDGFELKPDLLLSENSSDKEILNTASGYILGKEVKSLKDQNKEKQVDRKNMSPEFIDSYYPDLANRLLAAAKIWTVIDYFFAYKNLMEDNWGQVLKESIPRFALANDSLQYHLAISGMYKHIQDGHGFIRSDVLSNYFGTASPPIKIRFIENEAVVTYVFPDSIYKVTDIEKGDIILEVNGENIKDRAKRYAKYMSASNKTALYNYISYRILNGKDSSIVDLRIKTKNNKVKTIQVPRYNTFYMYARRNGKGRNHQQVFRLLNDDIGYADLDRLQTAQVEDMFEKFKNTKAIIFDMRGYPNGTAWSIAPHLTNKKDVIAANFRRYSPMNMRASIEGAENMTLFNQTIPSPKTPYYKGKTYMLIDERTQSQAEHTGLFFEAANHTKFIGSQTAGANGDVTNFTIPGKLTLFFSGHDVRHADGRQLQKTGLVPDVEIKPTIEGIREGKDEVLNKAIEVATKEIPKK